MDTALRPASSFFDRRPFPALLSATGALLIALAGIILVIVGAIHGDVGGSLGFAMIMIVPGLLGAFLVWWFGKWAFIVAGLFGAILLAMFAPFLPFALSHPEGGGDFVMVVAFTAGAVAAIIGAVTGIIQWRRKADQPGASAAQRLVYRLILGVVLALALLSVVATTLATTKVSAADKAGASPMEMTAFVFAPEQVQAVAGQTVRMVVSNTDPALHTFTLDEAGINVTVPAGAERIIEFTAPAAGTYTWYCIPHSQAGASGRTGMVGILVVAP